MSNFRGGLSDVSAKTATLPVARQLVSAQLLASRSLNTNCPFFLDLVLWSVCWSCWTGCCPCNFYSVPPIKLLLSRSVRYGCSHPVLAFCCPAVATAYTYTRRTYYLLWSYWQTDCRQVNRCFPGTYSCVKGLGPRWHLVGSASVFKSNEKCFIDTLIQKIFF